MKKNVYQLGLLCVFIYCIIYSLSQVAVGYYEQHMSAYLLASHVFLVTIVFYFLTTLITGKLGNTYQRVIKNLGIVIKINITTALAWLTIIYALKYIEPATALTINTGILPIATMILSLLIREVTKPTRMDFLFAVILFLFIALLCAHLIQDDLISNKLPIEDLVFGIALCAISGAANACNTIYAKVLSQRHFTPEQVLSVRFYFAALAAFIILFTISPNWLPDTHEIVPILVVAFTSVIIPIYLLQTGLAFSNAIAAGLIISTIPAITFFMELLNPAIQFSTTQLILIVLISITTLSAAYYKIRQGT